MVLRKDLFSLNFSLGDVATCSPAVSRIVVNGMFGQNSVRMAFKQNLAGTVF